MDIKIAIVTCTPTLELFKALHGACYLTARCRFVQVYLAKPREFAILKSASYRRIPNNVNPPRITSSISEKTNLKGLRTIIVCVLLHCRSVRFLTSVYRTAPHRTAPHRTAPHRTAPHRTAPHRTALCEYHKNIHTAL